MLRRGLTVMEEKMQQMEDKLIDQEARSGWNNMVFHVVEKDQGEDCAKTISNIISQHHSAEEQRHPAHSLFVSLITMIVSG